MGHGGTCDSSACSTRASRRLSGIMTEGGSRCCSAHISCARLHSSSAPHSLSLISGFTGSSCCLSKHPASSKLHHALLPHRQSAIRQDSASRRCAAFAYSLQCCVISMLPYILPFIDKSYLCPHAASAHSLHISSATSFYPSGTRCLTNVLASILTPSLPEVRLSVGMSMRCCACLQACAAASR